MGVQRRNQALPNVTGAASDENPMNLCHFYSKIDS
jgi:hypothetical protein